jgi:prepilin-type N-terminal cleavage/methylation domain-containing protein
MRGFSLLELLVAVVLFASGVAALAWAISAGLSASVNIESMDLALNIAQSKMEDIKDRSFDTIVAEGDYGPLADPDFPDYDVTVSIADGDDPMRVDVTVTWDARGGQTSVTLTTLVTNI